MTTKKSNKIVTESEKNMRAVRESARRQRKNRAARDLVLDKSKDDPTEDPKVAPKRQRKRLGLPDRGECDPEKLRRRTTARLKRWSPYPSSPQGFAPSLKDVMEARASVYQAEGRDVCEIWKRIDLVERRTRFVPLNPSRDPSFYLKPAKKSVCCLWCTEPIEGLPIPYPVKFATRSCDSFIVRDQYCSIGCALAAINERKESKSIFRAMLRRVYGVGTRVPGTRQIRQLTPAPPRQALVKFGGYLTPDAFRAHSFMGVETSTATPPFVPLSSGIVEIEKVETSIEEKLDDGAIEAFQVTSMAMFARPTPIENANPRQFQKGTYARLPTVEEQLEASNRRLRLQQNSINPEKPKMRTLRDFNFFKAKR